MINELWSLFNHLASWNHKHYTTDPNVSTISTFGPWCKNVLMVPIVVTEWQCGNENDAVIVTPKYQSNHKISLDTSQNAIFYTFITQVSICLFWKSLQHGHWDVTRPCFYIMLWTMKIKEHNKTLHPFCHWRKSNRTINQQKHVQ